MARQKVSQAEREQAIADLRESAPKGTTIFTVVRHVSAPGTSRLIALFVLGPDSQGHLRPLEITVDTSRILDLRLDRVRHSEPGVRVYGAGQDMCWWLVNRLAKAVWGESQDWGEYYRNETL